MFVEPRAVDPLERHSNVTTLLADEGSGAKNKYTQNTYSARDSVDTRGLNLANSFTRGMSES